MSFMTACLNNCSSEYLSHLENRNTDTAIYQLVNIKWTLTLLSNKGIRGLLEKYPTFGREKETGLLGALDT